MAHFRINFKSKALGMEMSCEVILPQHSAVTGRDHPKYKTLWLLHGGGDDASRWGRQTSIERYASERGIAVVMPCVHLSGYTDMNHGGKYFTFVADELPALMRKWFPLSDAREDNYIAGLSMGGEGCMKIGLARPENYCAIGCMSAGGITDSEPMGKKKWFFLSPWELAKRNEMMYGNSFPYGGKEDISANAILIARDGLPAPRIFHAVGTEDFGLAAARAGRDFYQSFPGNPFDYEYREYPGAHKWNFWDEHIQDFLDYCGLPRQVEGFRD